MIKEITNNNLSEALEQDIAILDFNAGWCGPCKMLAPILEEISGEMAGKASFYGIDVDENMDLAAQYGVQSIPTLIVLKKGTPVSKTLGFMPKPQLQSWIDAGIQG